MIGMEKAEGIGLACYAPLLDNVDYTNWKADMTHYDNHRIYGTPSYYVQKLFMNYQGSSLSRRKQISCLWKRRGQSSTAASVLPRLRPEPVFLTFSISGCRPEWRNRFDEAEKVAPKEGTEEINGSEFIYELPGYVLTVLKFVR